MQLTSNRTKVQNWVKVRPTPHATPLDFLQNLNFLQNLKAQIRMQSITLIDQLHISFHPQVPQCPDDLYTPPSALVLQTIKNNYSALKGQVSQ